MTTKIYKRNFFSMAPIKYIGNRAASCCGRAASRCVGALLILMLFLSPPLSLAEPTKPAPTGQKKEQAKNSKDDCGQDTVTCSTSSGDPVSTATGEFWFEAVDATLPGIGVTFNFVRRYNSQVESIGPWGRGWSHAYAARLMVQTPSGDVVLRNGIGQEMRFSRQADGSFLAEPNVRSRLITTTTGYELIRHTQTRLHFDTTGQLKSQTDRNGQGLTFSYDANGKLITITDSVGRNVSLNYTAGRLTKLILLDGRSVNYAYVNGRLAQATDLRGGVTTYTYNDQGLLSSITDANGHRIVANTYDASGRVIAQVDARNASNRFRYQLFGPYFRTMMTDALGNNRYHWYSKNVLVETTDALGNHTFYEYDNRVNLIKIIDARGDRTSMTYDARGNVLTRTAPDGATQRFTYNLNNDVLTAQDARGHTTTYEYNAAGNLIKVTHPDGTFQSLERATSGLVLSSTNENNHTTRYAYDTFGNLVEVTAPLGERTTFTYDSTGRKNSQLEARGNVPGNDPDDYRTRYIYDADDKLLTVIDPLNHKTTFEYDAVGNLTKRVDANNHATRYVYDEKNRLTKVTSAEGEITEYGYDGVDNLISRKDANRHTTLMNYDARRLLTHVTTPLGHQWSYTYDEVGNRVLQKDPLDVTTTYEYDARSRLVGIDYGDTTADIRYQYDRNNNRTSMHDGSGENTYRYDERNRIKSVCRGAACFQYWYDGVNNIRKQINPNAAETNYHYDDNQLMRSLATVEGRTQFRYDPAGRLIETIFPVGNGHRETRTYDRAGRLAAVQSKRLGAITTSFGYTHDAVGNVLSEVTTGYTRHYEYDAVDRLTKTCLNAVCVSAAAAALTHYEYDGVGNRLKQTTASQVTGYSYDEDDRLTRVRLPDGTNRNNAFDNVGRQTAEGSRRYTYDAANRLVRVQDSSATTAYAYDGDGLRLAATKHADGAAQTTHYAWDVNNAMALLAAETDDSGSVLRHYTYGSDITPVSLTADSGTFFYHSDALGSTAALSSSAGIKVASYEYEPFGGTRSVDETALAPRSNPIRFTGQYLDDTGLYHLRARQYNTNTGRFLTTDPIPAALQDPYVATYVYAGNNPLQFVDPEGESQTKKEAYARAKEWWFKKQEKEGTLPADWDINPCPLPERIQRIFDLWPKDSWNDKIFGWFI